MNEEDLFPQTKAGDEDGPKNRAEDQSPGGEDQPEFGVPARVDRHEEAETQHRDHAGELPVDNRRGVVPDGGEGVEEEVDFTVELAQPRQHRIR